MLFAAQRPWLEAAALMRHPVWRDQGQLDFAQPSVPPGSGDAGGEEAEIVGEGAVGVVGDACAQDGDRLGR